VTVTQLSRLPSQDGSIPSSRTGLLIIRAWIEEGSSEPLRAHNRLTTDVSSGFEQTMTLSQVPTVCEVLETWLGNVPSGSAALSVSEAASRERHAAVTRGRSR
jgi:hypothetical protein